MGALFVLLFLVPLGIIIVILNSLFGSLVQWITLSLESGFFSLIFCVSYNFILTARQCAEQCKLR